MKKLLIALLIVLTTPCFAQTDPAKDLAVCKRNYVIAKDSIINYYRPRLLLASMESTSLSDSLQKRNAELIPLQKFYTKEKRHKRRFLLVEYDNRATRGVVVGFIGVFLLNALRKP